MKSLCDRSDTHHRITPKSNLCVESSSHENKGETDKRYKAFHWGMITNFFHRLGK